MFEDLSPELQEKARACKSVDELMALAEAEGFELPDDALDTLSGGEPICPEFETYVSSCYEFIQLDGGHLCNIVTELLSSNGEFSCQIYKDKRK